MKAKIALEDGTVFEGESFGATGERTGEVVFNTSMAGYQEILTDPSYKGQIVTMTYPLIGNYGVNHEDVESKKPFVEGFVVKECSPIASNWRSREILSDYLEENNIIGIEGVDTRALTRHIRLEGAMRAVISTEDMDDRSLAGKAKASPGLIGRDLVKDVSCEKSYLWENVFQEDKGDGRIGAKKRGRFRVTVLDCGAKYNIHRELVNVGCEVVVVPARTGAVEMLGMEPDGILLSNGPGDPAGVPYVVETIKEIISALLNKTISVPVMGICLGHQMLGLAFSGRTFKLKFGHHGANHPVKDLRTGKVLITAQNHGFCVEMEENKKGGKYCMLGDKDLEITHINLNDGTCEGMKHRSLPVFSVQFHPEASPGPHDAKYLFGEFYDLMKRKN